MGHEKRLRIIAFRNQVKQTERLFKILQNEALLTSAWSVPELKILLQGGSYDLFLCVAASRGGAWREALRQVQQYSPLLQKVVFSLKAGTQDSEKMTAAGAANVITSRIREESLLQMLQKFAAEIKPAPQRAAAMVLPGPGSRSISLR